MIRYIARPVFTLLLVAACLSPLAGCAMFHSEKDLDADGADSTAAVDDKASPAEKLEVTGADDEQPEVTPDKTKAAAKDEKAPSADDLKKKRKDLVNKERALVKQQRDLDVARLKLKQTRMNNENADRRNAVELERAGIDLGLAQRRFSNFQEKDVPARIGWHELGLDRATDRVRENEEELEQLEVMYREDEFAEQTKEIVIERSRRNLERSQRDLELRRNDFAALTDENIPLERRDHELRIIDQENSIKNIREKIAVGTIDQQIALINAEGEIIRLENELADTREEIEELKEKLAEMEKAIAEAKPDAEEQE